MEIFPYLRCSKNCLNVSNWKLNGQDHPLGDAHSDWEPGMDIHLSLDLGLDMPQILKDSGLTDSHLQAVDLALSWYSPQTYLRGSVYGLNQNPLRIPLENPESMVQTLDCIIPGDLLAHKLEIKVILMARYLQSEAKITARLPGAILLEKVKKIYLEGLASRFPMRLISFRDDPNLANGGAWVLRWDPASPDMPILSPDFCLLINKDHEKVSEAILKTKRNEADDAIISAMYHDVGRSLITGLINNEHFRSHASDFENDTVGGSIYNLLKAFQVSSLEELYANYLNAPDNYETWLQEKLSLFYSGGSVS